MPLQFYPLKVSIVRYETDPAVQIGFTIPEAQKEAFKFDPGQYLTISLTIEGKQVRRAYSICSATQDPAISVLIKRVDGGLVSNYLNDQVKIGQTINVLPPNGHFKLEVAKSQALPQAVKHYYFFGAGSGITPLTSMITSLLENEPLSHCHLLYGNRDQDNMIFKQKLDRLQLVYGDRFKLKYILSRPLEPKKSGLFKSTPNTNQTPWQGEIGRVDKNSIQRFLNEVQTDKAPVDGYYICGPGTMIEATYDSLLELGMDKELIHREYFSAPASTLSEEAIIAKELPRITAAVQVTLDGNIHNLTVKDDTNVVQAMLDKNIEPPYSCLSGTCSTCKAKLEKGEVHMDVSIGLEDDEKEKGYILTCQARPLTEELTINYDTQE
ncbi:ferredoxin--NADP reductase [Saprospiraceae bacterium]|nr:ferredoxin--NADP reductase [Saprospiraceae bacterium]